MENQATYELIEQYLQGKLTDSSLAEFEARLKNDENFASEVETVKALHGLVDLEGDRRALEMIDQASTEFTGRKLVMRRRFIGLAIAAAIALVFMVIFPWNGGDTNLNEELFAENFSPYRAPSVSRSNGLVATWDIAKSAYEKQDYETVIKTLETDNLSQEDYLAQFYIGISCLAKSPSELNKAVSSFQNVLSSDNDYRQAAEWYLGLALIKQNKNVAAKKHFNQMINQGNTYQRDAILGLLEKL